jgi:GntR family transcriptional regulator
VIIDPESPEHPYQQLAEHLREQIRARHITHRLPSYTTLCEESGLSLGTVQRAIKVLTGKG